MRIFELPATDAEADKLVGPDFQIGEEKFVGGPFMPAGQMVNLFNVTQATDVALRAAGYIRIITSVLDEDGVARLERLVYNTDVQVPLELLGEIATWLVEEYAARPTTPSSGSPAGSTPTPATSKDGSAAKASK